MKKTVINAIVCLLLGVVVFLAAKPTNGFDVSFDAGSFYISPEAEEVYSDRENALRGNQRDGGEWYTGAIVESGAMDLDPGRYTFTLNGTFEGDVSVEIYSPGYVGKDNTAGRVFATAEITASSGFYQLNAEINEVVRGARLRIVRNSVGAVSIRTVHGEGDVYSDTVVLAALAALAAFFALMVLSRRKKELQNRGYGSVAALFCCMLAAVIATAPLARQVLPYGHDVSFHLNRIDGIADGMRSGQFPVRLNPVFLGGYGYADPAMYPAAFLYFPAALRLLGVSTIVSYQIFILTINCATAGVAYISFKRLLKRRDLAVFAAVAYTLCLYRLICVFTRGAVGELLAMVFLPAVLLGMYEVFFADEKRGARWLAVGFLGIVNSHILSLEIVLLFCAVFLVINIQCMTEKKRLKALLTAAAVVIALSLWITVPMIKLMRTEMYVTAYSRSIADDAAYPFELFSTFVSSSGLSGSRDAAFTTMPLTVGGLLGLGALLFVFLWYFKRPDKPEEKRLGRLGFASLILAIAALFISSTLFPWEMVSKIPYVGDFLSFIQFPWRYLGVASIGLVLVMTAAVARLCDFTARRRFVIFACTAVVALSVSPYLDGYMQNASQGTILREKYTPLSTFYIGGQEYLHKGTYKESIETREPTVISEKALITGVEKQYLNVGVEYINAENGAFAELPLYYYEGYNATDDEGNRLRVDAGTNGVVRVWLNAGSGTVSVKYIPPVIYRVAELLSLLTALGIITVLIYKRRSKGLKNKSFKPGFVPSHGGRNNSRKKEGMFINMEKKYLPLTDDELDANPNIRLITTDDGEAVQIIDQTLLPNELKLLTLSGAEELYEAIYSLRVRGAPAIGIFAAYAVYVLATRIEFTDYDGFYEEFTRLRKYLDSSRPTAVNLSKQLGRMDAVVQGNKSLPVEELLNELRAEAFAIHREDIAMCLAISEYGLELVKDGDGVLTHCNAGPLATSRYGTGIGPILLAQARGIKLRAYCDETRPLLQGARLTTYELHQAGVDTTLICDNMASIVMSEGKIQAAFVGCDRVAVNGDVANKIGTSGVAILAKHYGIPVYVFCPSSTIDPKCKTGADIKIELREPEEIKEKFFVQPMAPEGVKCYNPAFDVTPNELITAIVTENGICRPPYSESLRKLYE